MRLWTQARLMGTYAANVMISLFYQKETLLDYNFMNFAHSTRNDYIIIHIVHLISKHLA